MISSDIVIIALAGFFSGIIKTGVGVGAGLFLLPTLALAFPAKAALGLGAPLMLVSDAIGLRYYWKQWLPSADLARLFLAALPGLILGVALLPLIPGEIFRTCVGIFCVFYILSLLWPHFPRVTLLKKLFGKLIEGGAAALETDQSKEVEQVYFEDLHPEAQCRFRVKNFGPLTVAVGSHGVHLYERVSEKIREKLPDIYARLGVS